MTHMMVSQVQEGGVHRRLVSEMNISKCPATAIVILQWLAMPNLSLRVEHAFVFCTTILNEWKTCSGDAAIYDMIIR